MKARKKEVMVEEYCHYSKEIRVVDLNGLNPRWITEEKYVEEYDFVPIVVCPDCKKFKSKCTTCNNYGYVPKEKDGEYE